MDEIYDILSKTKVVTLENTFKKVRLDGSFKGALSRSARSPS